MRHIAIILLLISPAFCADQPPCLIVKHASTSHQLLVSSASWQFVSGEFPQGMKWKSNISDGYIRKIKAAGGKVVIVPQDYSSADLEHAKAECTDTPTASPGR